MEEYEDRGKKSRIARALRYATMTGAATLVFASGMASGMFVDGTSETLLAYRTDVASASRPATRVNPTLVSYRQNARSITTEAQPVTTAAAWFPEHNSVHWDVSLAPGQDMSGLSIRNSHSDRNLVVILNSVGSSGEWIRAGVVNVAAGREASIHPPTGSYAMTVISLPLSMPYADLERGSPSKTVHFDLMDPETADTIPVTRFQVSDGQPERLPDLTTYASKEDAEGDEA